VNSDGKEPDLVTLTRSWKLAESFMMPKLQNQIMREIHFSFLTLNCAGPSYENFEDFAKIALNHGNGENKLVEVGAWVMVWADKKFIDQLSNEVPLAMFRKALRLTKNEPSWVTAQRSTLALFYVNESNAACN
jgi:hypothetical protein